MTRPVADLLADRGDGLFLVGGHGPVALQPGDAVDEVGQQLGAVGRVDDLRVEHGGVIFAALVGGDGKGRVGRGADHLEAVRQFGDAVAVAHPDRVFRALGPEPVEERAFLEDLDIGAAEFAVMAALDRAAKLVAERLLAIADGKDRHAGIEDRLRRARAALVGDGGRAAGENHRLGLEALKPSSADWNGTISE
jgi:hypothetical protein